LIYNPNLSLFTNNNDIEINNDEDIQTAKLGLVDGLAGKLIKKINIQKSSYS